MHESQIEDERLYGQVRAIIRSPSAILDIGKCAEQALQEFALANGHTYASPAGEEAMLLKYAAAVMGFVTAYELNDMASGDSFEDFVCATADIDPVGEMIQQHEAPFAAAAVAYLFIDCTQTLQMHLLRSYMKADHIPYVDETDVEAADVMALVMVKAIGEALARALGFETAH